MNTGIGRRGVLAGLGFTVPSGAPADAARREAARPAAALAALERRAGGRLGVFALDTGSGAAFGHRGGERFGMCSTFKLPLCGLVLREAEKGRLRLEEEIAFSAADMVVHAPVMRRLLEVGRASILTMAEAAQTTRDNVAANLLVKRLGGPLAVTALLRECGDSGTRLDRYEPDLNLTPPGELRDTTTPEAMARLVGSLVLGPVLGQASQGRLQAWMVSTGTGLRRLRAGFPRGWRAGDKTGTFLARGLPNKHNDVAVVWPPGRAPLVIAAFYEAPGAFETMRPQDDRVLADAGRIAVRGG